MPDRYHGRTTRSFARLRARVLEASDICWLCGQAGADTVDHVVPLKLAPHLGEDIDNLRPAHRGCNSSKGARLAEVARPVQLSRRW